MPVSGFTDFAHAVEFLCQQFGGSVTSGHRSAKRNAAVGGVPNSLHLQGLAVDIVLDDPAHHGEFLMACSRLGLRAIDEGDHIHVQVTT
jgi:hypothetical protein